MSLNQEVAEFVSYRKAMALGGAARSKEDRACSGMTIHNQGRLKATGVGLGNRNNIERGTERLKIEFGRKIWRQRMDPLSDG